MDETPKAGEVTNKPRRLLLGIKRRDPIKPGEVLIITAFALIVILVVHFAIEKIEFNADVNHAKVVSNEVIADIQARNGTAAWNLGTPSFQKSYSPDGLTQGFKSIEIATLRPPTLDQQINGNGPSGRTIFLIYKYSALKVPYYLRVAIQGKSGSWKLTEITGNSDESQLE